MDKTKKQTVLVVDDEPHIVNLVKLSLGDQRYNVVGAYSAREALTALKSNRPDLILVDIMMPGMDGYQLCREIRDFPENKNTPIIILSAKNQFYDKLHAVEVGADDYITKPFDPTELERRIKLNTVETKIKEGV
ncbi:MAG: response regulator transcription factor [Candidatus Nanoarchaeia archaeon]